MEKQPRLWFLMLVLQAWACANSFTWRFVMMKVLLIVASLAMFGLAGCHASGSVDTHSQTQIVP
jgi:hypothetical protein